MHGDLIRACQPLEMHYSTQRSGEKFPALHAHDFYEIYLFLNGEVTYVIEDYSRRLAPGDLVIVPPGKLHRAAFDDLDKPYERLLAYVSPDFMKSLQIINFSVVEYLDNMSAMHSYCRSLSSDDTKAWIELFNSYKSKVDDPAYQLELLCRLGALISRVCLKNGAIIALSPNSFIESVVTYINEHYREDLTLDRLSQHFFLTSAYLSHQFRKYAQLSIHQYITAKRMMLSRTLLLQGISPLVVSSSCGYQDYSSFYRAFIRSAGLSPREWQQSQLREKKENPQDNF